MTRPALATLVVAVMACAILGIGMGDAPADREPAPAAASRAAIAAGGAEARRGRDLFEAEGCDRCHAVAAIGADGKLGPRLDTLDEDLEDNLESIAEPREDIADGYSASLMPDDFDERLSDSELRALAAFVTTASGGEARRDDEGAGSDGTGRGRGRGRGGEG